MHYGVLSITESKKLIDPVLYLYAIIWALKRELHIVYNYIGVQQYLRMYCVRSTAYNNAYIGEPAHREKKRAFYPRAQQHTTALIAVKAEGSDF